MKKTLLSILALTLVVVAFAQATGVPATAPFGPINGNPATAPTVDSIQKELADTKAQLAQTQQAATVEINRLSVLAERNEFAYRLTVANQQVQALNNELVGAKARAEELQKSLIDVQSRYDMEKAKVEALLKKHPGEAVAAQQSAKPMPTLPGDPAKK